MKNNGEIVSKVSRRKRHQCRFPGPFQRWKLDIYYGTVWRCTCGQNWVWVRQWIDGRGINGWKKLHI